MTFSKKDWIQIKKLLFASTQTFSPHFIRRISLNKVCSTHQAHETKGCLLVLPSGPRPSYLNMKLRLHTVSKWHLLFSASTQNQKTSSNQRAAPHWRHPLETCCRSNTACFACLTQSTTFESKDRKKCVWTSAENLSSHCHHCSKATRGARALPDRCWKALQLSVHIS